MNSEKVKEIKKALEFNAGCEQHDNLSYIAVTSNQIVYEERFNYINELKSENERLSSRYRNLEINYNDILQHYREYEVENQQLKDRIVELEEYIKGNEQDAKAFVKGWKKDLETELKQFAKAIEVNLLNEFTIDDDILLSDLEFSGAIINKVLNDTLKKFLSGSEKPNN